MSFPTTVNGTTNVAEAPGGYGPFSYGGALWVVNHIAVAGQWQLLVFKSIDSGVTWTEVDSLNGPLGDSVAYCACQSSANTEQLYVIHTEGGNATTIRLFDMLAEAWDVSPFASDNQIQTTAVVYRAVDDSLVMVGPGSVTLLDQVHALPAFVIFDIQALTFSTYAQLDYDDYLTISIWDQSTLGLVCDPDGNVTVFMAQATRPSTASRQTIEFFDSGDWTVPFDCVEVISVQCWGGGGGGASSVGDGSGGGGGGGYSASTGPFATTPGDLVPVTCGPGGGPGLPGSDASMFGITGFGGNGGTLGGAGGAGGGGNLSGGSGGASDVQSGGGGGGGADTLNTLNGTNGDDGNGGGQAFGGVPGGGAGAFKEFNQAENGLDSGDNNAGGGGGGASGVPPNEVGGSGGSGLVRIMYDPFVNSNPGRMWQQTIPAAGGKLGDLTEIPEGQFDYGHYPQFDCASGPDYAYIAFTGVTDTAWAMIRVGLSTYDTPFVFTFEDLDTGATTPSSPSTAVDDQKKYLTYIMYDADLLTVSFLYRTKDGVDPWIDPISLGDFTDPGCRILTAFLDSLFVGTFGTATRAELAVTGSEGSDISMTLIAVLPGTNGNLIRFTLTQPAGSAINVTFDNDQTITAEIGIDYAGDWSAVATAIELAAPDLVTCTGSGTAGPSPILVDSYLSGGTSGQGA